MPNEMFGPNSGGIDFKINLLQCHQISDQIREDITYDAKAGDMDSHEHGLHLLKEFHSHFCVKWMAQTEQEIKDTEDGYAIPQELLRQILEYVALTAERKIKRTLGAVKKIKKLAKEVA